MYDIIDKRYNPGGYAAPAGAGMYDSIYNPTQVSTGGNNIYDRSSAPNTTRHNIYHPNSARKPQEYDTSDIRASGIQR